MTADEVRANLACEIKDQLVGRLNTVGLRAICAANTQLLEQGELCRIKAGTKPLYPPEFYICCTALLDLDDLVSEIVSVEQNVLDQLSRFLELTGDDREYLPFLALRVCAGGYTFELSETVNPGSLYFCESVSVAHILRNAPLPDVIMQSGMNELPAKCDFEGKLIAGKEIT